MEMHFRYSDRWSIKKVKNSPSGFYILFRENILVVNAGGNIQENIETFKARLLENPEIEGVCSA